MEIKKADWDQILIYIKKKLLENVENIGVLNNRKMIAETAVIALPEIATLESFLADIGQKKEKQNTQEPEIDAFSELWNLYPATGSFKYKGMEFKSSRVLRINRSVCHGLYMKALMSNKVKPEVILNALKKQLHLVKEESYDTGVNKLQFMPALEPWLRQSVWEAFVSEDSEETSSDTQDTGYSHDSNCA